MIANLFTGLFTRLFPVHVEADRVVPPSGFTARLTLFASGAMTFLAVFVMALSFAAGRLSDRWSGALLDTATVRVSAPEDQQDQQVKAVLQILQTTPGVKSARRIPAEETRKLLAPWFGPDLPVETLPIPALVEVHETGGGFDAEGLQLRLQAEAPGAVLDDHERWRRPLVAAARGMGWLSFAALLLIGVTTAAIVTLAAQAALAANGQVIRVLRLIGAEDRYIARAFELRFTQRAVLGAIGGALLGCIALALVPSSGASGFLTGLGFEGIEWFWPLILPVLAGVVAFAATRAAANRALGALK